jgi:hypothetical protein
MSSTANSSLVLKLMHSNVKPMRQIGTTIHSHFSTAFVTGTGSRQTNGFIEAVNGLLQAAKRKGLRISKGKSSSRRS